ncbi:hypothetical protein LCGC14_0845790 [marine sediment metagenome]|uniref:Uncharacterized protein n=1 Tax=marine sediment metagenome TaxID=412755 RepID=A0A0F9SIY0_9ZZZZ
METTKEEIRESVVEIMASCLSDNDVRPRVDELLQYLHSQGVVIKVDKKLPENRWPSSNYVSHPHFEPSHDAVSEAQQDMLKAGFTKTEPLI